MGSVKIPPLHRPTSLAFPDILKGMRSAHSLLAMIQVWGARTSIQAFSSLASCFVCFAFFSGAFASTRLGLGFTV